MWFRPNKKAGRWARPLYAVLWSLFRCVGGAAGEEGRQGADIAFSCGLAFASCRTAAAGAALARLLGLALGFRFNRCGRRCSLGSFRRLGGGSRFGNGSHWLLHFAFGAEAFAAGTLATVAALRAVTILAGRALFALWLLRSLFAFGTFFPFALRKLRLGLLRLWRGEAGVHVRHIVVEIVVLLPIGALAVLRLLGARDDAEIMFGVLEIVLRHHRVAARLGVARELEIFLGNMGGIAADLDVRTIALEVARQRIDMLAPAVPAALPVLVLVVGSHLVALILFSGKISVTLLADRHLPGLAIRKGPPWPRTGFILAS